MLKAELHAYHIWLNGRESPSAATWCRTCSKLCNIAAASALNNQEATASFLLLPNRIKNSTKEQSALNSSPVPAKQKHHPVRSNTGHGYPRSLEQSYQGATDHKQPILVRINNKAFIYWKLKTRAPYLFLTHQLKGYCQQGASEASLDNKVKLHIILLGVGGTIYN